MHENASILVVDDNPMNLKLATAVLQKSGYRVRTAQTAKEALALIDEEVPSLILMDIQMPEMDGLTLTRKLKSEARTREIFIVAFTAAAMKGDRERALDAGCEAYMTKPIDTRTLRARIGEFLASRTAPSGDVQ